MKETWFSYPYQKYTTKSSINPRQEFKNIPALFQTLKHFLNQRKQAKNNNNNNNNYLIFGSGKRETWKDFRNMLLPHPLVIQDDPQNKISHGRLWFVLKTENKMPWRRRKIMVSILHNEIKCMLCLKFLLRCEENHIVDNFISNSSFGNHMFRLTCNIFPFVYRVAQRSHVHKVTRQHRRYYFIPKSKPKWGVTTKLQSTELMIENVDNLKDRMCC